jgi:hypothetical protein
MSHRLVLTFDALAAAQQVDADAVGVDGDGRGGRAVARTGLASQPWT